MNDLDLRDELLSCSNFSFSHTEGLRDVVIAFEAHDGLAWRRVELMVDADDAAAIEQYVRFVRARAWANGRRPLDALPTETPPVVLALCPLLKGQR